MVVDHRAAELGARLAAEYETAKEALEAKTRLTGGKRLDFAGERTATLRYRWGATALGAPDNHDSDQRPETECCDNGEPRLRYSLVQRH